MAEEMITVMPIVGYSTVAHPSGTGMLILKHIPGIPPAGMTQEEVDRATVSLQYGIAAEQCIEIANALNALAARLQSAKQSLN